MSESVDRILDLIDAGLQTPVPDPEFGEVSPRNSSLCARCQWTPPADDSEFCPACRAWLLDDAPVERCLVCGFPDVPGHEARSTQHQPSVTVPIPRAARSHMEGFVDRMTDALIAGASWPIGPPPDGTAAAEAVFVDECVVMHTRWFRPSETCVTGPPRRYRIPVTRPLGFLREEMATLVPDAEIHDYTLAGTMERPDGVYRHVYARH